MLNDSNMNISPIVVYVDADACPVKNEIVDLCRTYEVDMVFVSSYAHFLSLPKPAKIVTVDEEKEAVDLYVANHAKKGDICVTQDHALASLLLAKGMYVLSPRGKEFTEKDMDQLLDVRFLSQKQRRMGKRTKGPKPYNQEDREQFKANLKKILEKKAGLSQKSSN
ncbi:YaiI/YqxD family protein [Alkalihalobacillus hemicellulosilyticus]|nr:YaiI/YqxD family protein [Halalkalibacter hemicellulosilyticus]